MDRYSFLNAAHTAFFAELYDQYLENPDGIEPSWRAFFQGFDFANEYSDGPVEQLSQAYTSTATSNTANVGNSGQIEQLQKEFAVLRLIDAYRTYGHLMTKTNPLRDRKVEHPDLSLEKFGLSQADLNISFEAAKTIQLPTSTLGQIIAQLEKVYCSTLGIEYKYITDEKIVSWIQNHYEAPEAKFNSEEKKEILHKLIEAVSFENFLNTKYVGQKRFSLEGLEAAIPAMDFLLDSAANRGVEEVVVGMAHRGRLNVLANVFKKPAQEIFSEFDGKDYDTVEGFDGDVKYHLGLSSARKTRSGKDLLINLTPNPSHLETVGAVIEGIARAKQDTVYTDSPSKVLPIALHGDAAISGQGIVYEIVQMAKLRGYKTEGTIHVVLNNQVGFTTNYTDGRSSTYSTDIAKVTASPVLHVNADDTEAAVRAFLFALDYRMTFGTDVFIDLVGYRKYGHNEGDEPKFTQPILYKLISKHPNARNIYNARLLEDKIVDETFVKSLEQQYKDALEVDLETSRKDEYAKIRTFMHENWKGFEIAEVDKMLADYDTKVSKEVLTQIAEVITELPEDKKFINKVKRLIGDRKAMFFEKDQLDWAMGELLAYGSLLTQGYDVRMSGQDVERGTFSHRHAVVKTEDTEESIILLNHLKEQKGEMRIFNSLLSEYAVLGFEYGYALTNPNTLTIWEAQFGDFSNGGQIMMDQYISAAEDKWTNQNGLVMLLPHGYENQGAEHSSARLERYLQLCAEDNMFVANVTTPANFFHLMRRQMVTNFRKPLIVMSPKSLLRHPEAVSSIKDFTEGKFQYVIDDPKADVSKVKSLVFCSGKFYYDLVAKREELGRDDIAFVRIEQLFPLPIEQIKEILAKYTNVEDYVWAQEEPKNMGAYSHMLMHFHEKPLRYAGTKAYSAPASGSSVRSKKRYAYAIAKVFDKNL
ncbi:2-oxoglutarate dehydrogenase E1 component [Myroides albus]|uniref:oxoglutarate dehydrogenase (succinyl-transferring) n=1 Tax=Myroides albus TaxID=2562892 RepID=A0A6I3LGG7_9FLAO|nr:2-oxoglutarate dehydrogenase E1 component [Myroides albus]MTG96894.1 2-oxoglutarate dehydrogenase E1 component [Myroides albus]UVD78357.1 2-oxoglutarate dehydrogenase E1 component [Myroides albus]